MITSMQGWLAAGYWPLWSTRRKLSCRVACGCIHSAVDYDGDGQTSSDRWPKLWRKRGRGGGHAETWFAMDVRGLRGEEVAGE